MNAILIEKYNKLLNSLENVILKTEDESLKNLSKDSFAKFIVDLAEIEKKEITYYENRLRRVEISDKNIEEVIEHINSFVDEDNKNLNEVPIQSSEEEKEDKNKEVINTENQLDVNDDKNLNEETSIENGKDIEIEDEKVVDAKSQSKGNDDLDLYIMENVYNNEDKNIVDEFQKLMLKLQEDFKNPNELAIKTWVKNYVSFVDRYKDVLDKNKLIAYMNKKVREYDKENKFVDKIDEYVSENELDVSEEKKETESIIEEEEVSKIDDESDEKTKSESKESEPLKILGIKKTYNSKAKNIALGVTALLGVGAVTALFDMSLFAIIPAFIIFKLFKKYGVSNVKLQSFLKKHKFTIDKDTNELVDENGNKVTEETVGKSKYEMIKNELMKLGTNVKEGMIKKDYKKNKLASIFLNSKIVQKYKDHKRKFEPLNANVDDVEKEEEENIRKGMGKC